MPRNLYVHIFGFRTCWISSLSSTLVYGLNTRHLSGPEVVNDVDNRPEQAGNTWMQYVVFCTERKFEDKVPFSKKRINRILNRLAEPKLNF
jgi:hypothetical protein